MTDTSKNSTLTEDWLKQGPEMEAAAGRAMESFEQVGQLLTETTEALVKKQTQMVTAGMSSMMESMQEWQRVRSPQDLLAVEATAFRSGIEAATKGVRDLNDIVRRCGYEMVELWLAGLPQDRRAGNGELERPPTQAAE